MDFFNNFCIGIHGITPEAVREKPRFEDIWPEIYETEIRGRVVVAHNASFDMGVMREAIQRSYLTDSDPTFSAWPEFDYLCTLVLARRVFALPSYRLPFVAEAAGVELTNHHDAGSDAHAAAAIVVSIAQSQGYDDLTELVTGVGMALGSMRPMQWSGVRSTGSYRGGGVRLEAVSPNPNADPDHPLYGQVVVFTGSLASMTRQQAWDLAATVGASCEKGVTKKTNILVMGDQDSARLNPGSTLSSKAKKAFELTANGQDIEVMSENDFLGLTSDIRMSGIRLPTAGS